MTRPHLSKLNTWANHENRVTAVFAPALALLCKEDNLPTREDELNRRLWFCVHQANRILHRFNQGLLCPPSFDAKNCPDADDGERAGARIRGLTLAPASTTIRKPTQTRARSSSSSNASALARRPEIGY